MANPTTNYSWPMPTSTDLVTDLPADFAAFGQPVDTSLKALNPETTLGDIAYRSSTANTNTRLAIGTTDQVLKVVGGVPAWGAASGGLTLITRQSFSAVANTGTTFDDVFTSTYKQYLVVMETLWAATATDDLYMQLRYAGPTTQAATYLGASQKWTAAAAGALTGSNNTSQMILATDMGVTGSPGSGQITFGLVGNSSQCGKFYGQYIDKDGNVFNFGGMQDTARTYTGFILSSAASNITGTLTVYGLATA